ncbi:hypothetical protein RQP46_001126 [Phenoliferia psychrophenolica]
MPGRSSPSLSDAESLDSLSSAGASTEPLPASDRPASPPPPAAPSSLPLPSSAAAARSRTSRPSAKQLAGGQDSDSSLTEQDDSDEDQDQDSKKSAATSRKRKSAETDDNASENEDPPELPKPDPDAAGEEDGAPPPPHARDDRSIGDASPTPEPLQQLFPKPQKPSSPSDSGSGSDDDPTPDGKRPSKRLRRGGPSRAASSEPHPSGSTSTTTNNHPPPPARNAVSPSLSLSDLEDRAESSELHPPPVASSSSSSSDEADEESERPPVTSLKKGGRGGATRGAGRARGRGRGGRGGRGGKRGGGPAAAAAAAPSSPPPEESNETVEAKREDSPLTSGPTSEHGQEPPEDKDKEHGDKVESDAAAKRSSTSSSSSGALALQSLPKKRKQSHSPSAAPGSPTGAHDAPTGLVEPTTPPPPDGLVELESDPQRLVEQLNQLEASAAAAAAEETTDEAPERPKVDKGKKRRHDDDDEELLALLQPEPVAEDEQRHEPGTPAGSEHEDDNADDFSLRKRADAMEALTRIEIDFARLRDKLYLERLADVEQERVGVETGTHPELLHLTRLIELRKERKLDLAKRWLDGLETAYERRRESEEHTVWEWWADGRAELRSTMLEDAFSKRRKLDREKRNMDRPKDGGLSPFLAPRPLPVVPLQHRRRVGFDGDVLTENEIAWALRHPDLRTDAQVSALDDDATMSDLERMGLREPMRHFAYDPSGYGGGMHNPSAFDPRAGGPSSLAAPFGYAPSFDPMQAGPSQNHFNPVGSGTHRPSTNARPNVFAKEQPHPAQQAVNHARSHSQSQGLRPFTGQFQPSSASASSYPEHDAWQKQQQREQQQQLQQHYAPSFDPSPSDGRRPSIPELSSSLDIVAEHRPRRVVDDAAALKADKARFTLDEHMSHHQSPKAAKNASAAAAPLTAPAFAIPPYNGAPKAAFPGAANGAPHFGHPAAAQRAGS